MSFNLNHDARVKVPCTNARVFGHGGNQEQVHNEVYEWLDKFAPPLPGQGFQWCERTYKSSLMPPGPGPYRPTPHRPYSAPLVLEKKAGTYFYFADKKIAMLFKLTWGGE